MLVRRSAFRSRRGKDEEEASDQQKRGQKRTLTSGAYVLIGLSRSGALDARGRRKYEPMCMDPLHRKGKEVVPRSDADANILFYSVDYG